MARPMFSPAQRVHSKLQKPPQVPAPGSGTAAAATNTQRQERTAADVTRACSSSRPRRLGRRANGPAAFVSLWGELGAVHPRRGEGGGGGEGEVAQAEMARLADAEDLVSGVLDEYADWPRLHLENYRTRSIVADSLSS